MKFTLGGETSQGKPAPGGWKGTTRSFILGNQSFSLPWRAGERMGDALPRAAIPEMTNVRYDVRYSGRVQGVGFRYVATVISCEHRVTGYVQNLPDGTVRMVVEGATSELDPFMEAIRRRMQRCIVDCRVVQAAATGEFEGFGVRA